METKEWKELKNKLDPLLSEELEAVERYCAFLRAQRVEEALQELNMMLKSKTEQ